MFVLDGNLVHFCGFKNCIRFYPAPSGIAVFHRDLAGFAAAKGSVRFPLDNPISYDLIRRIVVFRAKENRQRAAGERNTRRPCPVSGTSAADSCGFLPPANIEPHSASPFSCGCRRSTVEKSRLHQSAADEEDGYAPGKAGLPATDDSHAEFARIAASRTQNLTPAAITGKQQPNRMNPHAADLA